IYVGGHFTEAGGVPANGIAYWDGTRFQALGSGISGDFPVVFSLALFDDDGPGPLPVSLIVSGTFTFAGGVAAPGIARWDGADWHVLMPNSPGADMSIFALCVWDADEPGEGPEALYVGGFGYWPVGLWNLARRSNGLWESITPVERPSSGVNSLFPYDAD